MGEMWGEGGRGQPRERILTALITPSEPPLFPHLKAHQFPTNPGGQSRQCGLTGRSPELLLPPEAFHPHG